MKLLITILLCICCINPVSSQEAAVFETDVIAGNTSDLKITFVGHATLYLEHKGRIIHIDPWTQLADYSRLPKADLILITHEHRDHLDALAIDQIKKEGTSIVYTEIIGESRTDGKVFKNADSGTIDDIIIEAVPAYNIVHKRDNGDPYHPRGRGNGYVLTIDGLRIYIAGDTENAPELKEIKNIDVAFLPMNLPYTMTPEMVADLAAAIRPRILYPYHFGDTDTGRIVELLKTQPETEVRIRKLR